LLGTVLTVWGPNRFRVGYDVGESQAEE
jgi:hypothetical protein